MKPFRSDGGPIHEPTDEPDECPVCHEYLARDGTCSMCGLTPQEAAQSAREQVRAGLRDMEGRE